MQKRQHYIAIERRAIRDNRRFRGGHALLGGDMPARILHDPLDPEEEYHYLPEDIIKEHIETIPGLSKEAKAAYKKKSYGDIKKELFADYQQHGSQYGIQYIEPKEFYILPVTDSADEWAGGLIMNDLLPQLNAQGARLHGLTFTTMALPQLRHNDDSDRVSVIVMTAPEYRRFQKHMKKEDLTEVPTLDELFTEYRRHLPDRPPSVELEDKVAEMLSRVPRGPLNGTVVVAFDQQIAGSLASEEMARAGALVIKVEKPEGGDPKRNNSTQTAFNTFNAGKFGIVFGDSAKDQQLKRDLLARADVVIDNRTEGAQLRDTLLQEEIYKKERAKPLIFCSISGFGRGTDIPAYDRSVQAAAGMADLNGKLIPFPLIDMATGKEAAHAITQNLFHRERMTPNELLRTPCIRLDVSMAATALNMMANPIATYLDTGKAQSTIVPFDLYQAKDGKIAVAVATDPQFQRLCDLIGTPQIKKFKTNAQRQKHREEIEDVMSKSLRRHTVSEWMKILGEGKIAVQPVVSLDDAIKQYGREVIKPTTDGSLLITTPTASTLFPRTPHIGPAPQHDGDHAALGAFVKHLHKNKGPRAIRDALTVASGHAQVEFQRQYDFVDVDAIDFAKPSCDLDWANGKFFHVKKVGKVEAEPAKKMEIVEVRHNEVFSERVVAMEGDWKIKTSSGDQYLLPKVTFLKNYVPIKGKKGEFMANPELAPRKALRVTKDVQFMSPSGDRMYIPEGGWVAEGSDGPYGIHPNNIAGNYEIVPNQWVDKTSDATRHAAGKSARGRGGSKTED